VRNGRFNDVPWEWVEVYNPTTSPIDLTGYVLDDDNNNAHVAPDLPNVNIDPNSPFTGVVPAGGTAVLFSDELDPNTFQQAWGGGLNLIPISFWGAFEMGMNNSDDTVGLWDDPNTYTNDDRVLQTNAVVSQRYDEGAGFGDGLSQGPSLYLLDLSFDPADPASWGHCVVGADGCFAATLLLDPNSPPPFIPYHPGGDQASPGTFIAFTIEDADFNGNGIVDGRDFLTWQAGLGIGNSHATGDANGDGIVDEVDLAIWEAQYGGPPPLSAVSSAVPEPATIILLGMALAPLGLRRRRGHGS
ncbi:MAG: lamin tail domain-containing protein, partial [Planctomycetes bacterium]|nr:lamin tail domain-containing protein [Planctomycetota bacterium]